VTVAPERTNIDDRELEDLRALAKHYLGFQGLEAIA
jgi:hypothetical protein